jgi:hypothetical protein
LKGIKKAKKLAGRSGRTSRRTARKYKPNTVDKSGGRMVTYDSAPQGKEASAGLFEARALSPGRAKRVLTNTSVFVNIQFRAGPTRHREKDLENNIQHYTRRNVCAEGPGQTVSE